MNHRLLSFASKLTEKAVFAQIHKHLTTNKLYPKAQTAYREFHSTETALLPVKNDTLLNMNQQRVTLLVLLDLSAAFDTVNQTILLNHLSRDFGITAHVYSWFESYLHNRFQSVSINSWISDKLHINYGVPQGSCLGPLLFALYGSKLFKIIEQHLPDVHTPTLMTRNYTYLSMQILVLSAALLAM